MEFGQNLRAIVLKPLLKMLISLNIDADHLTVLGLVLGCLFYPLYYYARAWAFVFLALHVALDGLDGPLARACNKASRRGSFTDTFCDQLVVGITTMTLMDAGVVAVIPGVIYFFSYTVVVGFAMVRNALSIPYTWLVRPRFVVYLWMLIESYWLTGTINYILWGCNVLLGYKIYTGFRKIRKRL